MTTPSFSQSPALPEFFYNLPTELRQLILAETFKEAIAQDVLWNNRIIWLIVLFKIDGKGSLCASNIHACESALSSIDNFMIADLEFVVDQALYEMGSRACSIDYSEDHLSRTKIHRWMSMVEMIEAEEVSDNQIIASSRRENNKIIRECLEEYMKTSNTSNTGS
jgi:hypothetical protein